MNDKFEKIQNHIHESSDYVDMILKMSELQGKDYYTQKFSRHLYPHGNTYIARSLPLFLHTFSSIEELSYFPFVMARDGAVGLTTFFLKNPEPKSSTILAVDQDLYFLVPSVWAKNVVLYQKISKNDTAGDGLILFGMLHPNEILDSDLEIIFNQIKNNKFKRINSFFTFSNRFESKEESMVTVPYFQNMIQKLNSFLQMNITPLKYSEITNWNETNYTYFNINQKKYYCSDSLVEYMLLEKGLSPFGASKDSGQGMSIDVSFFHQVFLHDNWPSNYNQIRKIIETEYKSVTDYVMTELLNNPRDKRDIDDIVLVPEALADFLQRIFMIAKRVK